MQVTNRKLLSLSGVGLFSLLPLLLFEHREHSSAVAADDEVHRPSDLAQGAELFQVDPEPLSVTPSASAQADPNWVDPAVLPPEAVELTDLRDDPGPWIGRHIRFYFQFNQARANWEPYLTRFGPDDFVAFEAWGDHEYAWDEDVYLNPMPTLFARRGGVVEASLALARQYQRFDAVGVVRDVFLGEPWIEVESIRRKPEYVPEGTLLHVQRAREFEQLEQWALAEDQLQRALSAPLPAHAAGVLESMANEIANRRSELKAYHTRTR